MMKICPTCKKEFVTYSNEQVHCSHKCSHGSPEDRFWPKVDIRGKDECWPWIAGRKDNGRGNFYVNGKNIQAHRFMWELVNGEIPSEKIVCHTCDNGWCVNPSHLYLGTLSTNAQDREARGKNLRRIGSNHHMSKLTENDVVNIRIRYSIGDVSQQALSKECGVGRTTIQQVVERRSWKHV